MVTPSLAGAGIETWSVRGEHVLPSPLGFRIRVLARQSIGEKYGPDTLRAVPLESSLAVREMPLEGDDQLIRESHHAVLPTLAIPHHDRSMLEVQIFDPQTDALQQPQPRAVLKAGDQPIETFQGPQNAADFG